MESDDIEMNDKGEIAIHGITTAHWTSSIPSDPLGG